MTVKKYLEVIDAECEDGVYCEIQVPIAEGGESEVGVRKVRYDFILANPKT